MADGKLQQMRRSISSWSLSTVKKPKITVPKLKAPKIKIFRGGKKNRVDRNDEAAALEEVKAALLKAEGDGETRSGGAGTGETGSEVIHEPSAGGPQDGQPTIVLTVHEHRNPPEPPSPPPSPGLLAVKDDLEFIDSDETDTDVGIIEAVHPELDYSDQWFDACGTLTRSKENVFAEGFNDFDDGQESRYYDFVDYTVPKEKEPGTPPRNNAKGGSQKAREWVKSFDEKAESRIQKWMKINKSKTSSNLPKSKSEIRLDNLSDPTEKWCKRDEIKLNTMSKDASQAASFHNTDMKVEEKEQIECEKEKSTRKESLRKIFQVRGKISTKPIINSKKTTCKDTDIHITAAPCSLATTAGAPENSESLAVSQESFSCSTDTPSRADSTVATHQQHETSKASSFPSSVETHEVSEATQKTEALGVLDMTKYSQGVSDKQLLKRDLEKEVIQDENGSQQQSQESSVHITETTNSDVARTQVRSENEDNGCNVTFLPQTRNDSVKKCITNITSINAEGEGILTKKMNDPETKRENPLETDFKNINNDTQVTADFQKIETERVPSSCSLSQQKTVEPGEPGEEKEQPQVIHGPKGENVAAESPKIEAKDIKKSKFSGTNFPKSIKNFAGSVFSHQTGLKSKAEVKEDDSTEKKKKKAKMSPFIKDNLLKVSIKDKFEAVRDRGKTPCDVKEKQDNKAEEEKLPREKNLNPFEDDEGNPLADAAPKFSESNESSTEAEKESEVPVEDLHPSNTTQESPQSSSATRTPPANRSPSASPVSLEFASQVDSDDVKTVSHESSPGIDTSFVEEDGLRLRRDALLAIKAMDVDDTTTNYYSFLSASEEFQTPITEDKVLQAPASAKMLPKVADATNVPEIHPEATVTHEVQNGDGKTIENNELPPPITESPSNKCGSDTMTPKISNSNVEENLQSAANELNNKKMEEIKSQPVINGPSNTLPEVMLRHDASPHNGVSPQPSKKTPSEGVSKLRLGPSPCIESQDPPKPSPRTKKGRYGYSAAAGCAAVPGTPRDMTPSTREPSVSEKSVNGQLYSTIKSSDNKLTTDPEKGFISSTNAANELKRTPSSSGYAGQGANYYGGSDAEPIYWEIGEPQDAPPKPSPRNKKNQKTQHEVKLSQRKNVSQPSSNLMANEESQNKPLPEWINTRAPIPSPRGRKQRSLQSLPSVVPANDTMELVKKKLQMFSQEPLPDVRFPQEMPFMTKKEEEQFYSGKAASISYGFTPARVPPPSPPMRVRKASQISLPAAMAAEEAQTRQQKRRSLYVNPDGKAIPQPPSPRQARRRMGHTQDTKHRNIESAVKRLGEQVVCLTDLLAAVGLQDEATKQKTEELLTDVLYSVHSLMGGTAAGVWKVGGEGDLYGPSSRGEVHMEQVVKVLQSAFQVTQETIDRLRAEAQSRPPPEVSLQLNVKEARDLRPKTVKGTTNPYVIVSVPSSSASHRTRLEKDTLWPKWNQEFTLPISNFQKEYLRLEVWHEHDAVKMRQALTAVRDIKGVSRLVRGTTAQVQHQTSHLLGQVVVSVKDLSERGADGWFMLEKNEERSKERGSIHLAGTVTSKAQLENKNRQSYDALLARLVHHQLTTTNNNNNEHSEWSRPWNGHLSGPGVAPLAQYAIMLDLSDAAIQLAWWKVGCRVSTTDAEWILSRLQGVQTAMLKNLYQDEEILELRSSFTNFVHGHAERLRDLHKAFPPSSGVIARRQLTFTLKTLQCMQNHADTRALLDLEGLPHLHEIVTSSLATHAKNWWTTVIDELRDVRTTDEQICHVINIIKESHTFLSVAANTYNAIFMKEMNIPYMQTTYLMVSKKVNPCVRPLVMNIYNRLPALGDLEEEEMEESEYRLEVGTSLWELYMNLGRLHQLGESLPAEARAESGVREYHRWFSRGVLRWLELALCRARSMIKKAVDLDMLEPQDNYCKFSSSASDTLGIFNDVKIWWQKLAWPDPENSAVVLTKILEDICSCVISYSNLIREKVEQIFHAQENITRAFITEQICVGLNNIERVRTEMVNLPTQFGFQDLLQKICAAGNGDSAAAQLEATVDRLIVNAAENMEAKVNEFIDTVLEKMRPTLERAVNEACEAQSSRPLLAQVLDPTLELTLDRLNASNFKRFLWRVWEVVVEIFNATVMRNTERRKANYFGGVHSILKATLNFFSPSDDKGLDEKTAMTPAYTSLMELLESLRMSSESLIAQYYQERYEEQMEEILPCKARLYARALFTKPGKLIVEVIMAKDMVLESDGTSITSRGGGLGFTPHQPVDSYVKVQLVPQEWFPAATIRKTKTQRKQDPAVYEETFEYDLSKTDDGVRAGFLLITLKDYNLGFTNTFIGEAVVPFSSLPCVDSSQVHTVPNTCFTMTSPGLDIGYKSLRALQLRTGDKVASAFIKKVSKRLIEPKVKASTPLRPDEDKARSKSPNMRERLKFS